MAEAQAIWTGMRRTPRYLFGGAAELTGAKTDKYLVCETSQLSRFGCFVKTTSPFLPGSMVTIRITHQNASFFSAAKVIYVLDGGMGIAFESVSPENETILNAWLAVCAQGA